MLNNFNKTNKLKQFTGSIKEYIYNNRTINLIESKKKIS